MLVLINHQRAYPFANCLCALVFVVWPFLLLAGPRTVGHSTPTKVCGFFPANVAQKRRLHHCSEIDVEVQACLRINELGDMEPAAQIYKGIATAQNIDATQKAVLQASHRHPIC